MGKSQRRSLPGARHTVGDHTRQPGALARPPALAARRYKGESAHFKGRADVPVSPGVAVTLACRARPACGRNPGQTSVACRRWGHPACAPFWSGTAIEGAERDRALEVGLQVQRGSDWVDHRAAASRACPAVRKGGVVLGDGSRMTVSVLTHVFARRNRCRLGRTRAAALGTVSAHRTLRTPTVNLLGLPAACRVW